MSLASILRKVALVLTSLFAVGGIAFALGYAFEDLSGWAPWLLTAAVVVPLVGLTAMAVRSPRRALHVLVAAIGLFAVWAVLTLFVDIDAPTVPVIAVVLALPIAVVGQRYATQAGELLIAVAAVPLLLLVVRLLTEWGAEGPGLQGALGTSTGAVVVPLLVLAMLFLAGGVAGRHGPAGHAPVEPKTPATRT
ncbi:hypothetical protein [Intrasporangium sp.]|jgi:hypothetical protein|uniref:hypothetical protein n=1 Tax=Intrasporangium sp. TaxID=1925024 RepID=UPI003365B288